MPLETAVAKKQMRILYDHQVFSLQNAGGASRYHYELAKHLSPLPDISVSALIGFNDSAYPIESLKCPGTRVLSIRSKLKPGLLRYATNELLIGLCSLASGRYDIYHPTLYRAMPYPRSSKVVVTHHDCTHERFPNMFPDVNRIVRTKEKLFLAADAIICVSESSRKDLLHFYAIDPRKTHVVYHGLNPILRERRITEQFNQAERRPYLLYVGSRTGYKNFVGFMQAYATSGLAKDYDILAIGGGPWNAEEIKIARDLNVLDRLSLIPTANDGVLAEAYACAALLVYPSFYEGFGFPPLEAMSVGCVTAVARTSSIPEVCGDAAFYFDPSDQSSIVKTVTDALNSPSRELKIDAGKELVRKFSWARCAERTLQIYRSN